MFGIYATLQGINISYHILPGERENHLQKCLHHILVGDFNPVEKILVKLDEIGVKIKIFETTTQIMFGIYVRFETLLLFLSKHPF